MNDKLASIGFYTLEDKRAMNCSVNSPLWRCELLITGVCNFHCPYCRTRNIGHIDSKLAVEIIQEWAREGLKNIRFSGGEPTLHPDLNNFVWFVKTLGVERIAISTNGSAKQTLYDELIKFGVNDFSVSLDACCSSTGKTMTGKEQAWEDTVENIKFLASRVYTTVGIVLTEDNLSEAEQTINLAHSLGVSDIRVIPAAQNGCKLQALNLQQDILNKYPILNYRIKNAQCGMNIRGIRLGDCFRCHLVLDDMAVDEQGYHYPCIIYLRERGNPIGKFEGNMEYVRKGRMAWCLSHNTYKDPICRNNCLDVCVDYNNRCQELKE